jgi:polar amino acid transport system substrate-binding protein
MVIVTAFVFLETSTVSASSYPKKLLFCFTNWKPYEYCEGETVKGVNVEITEAVASVLGIKTQWVAYPWPRCVKMAKDGEVDGLMSLYRSKEREVVFYFPDENLNLDESVFITYSGSGINFDGTIQSITEMDVLVARENSYGKTFDEATNFRRRTAPHQDNVLLMIASKRCKIGIGSRGRFENMIKERGLAEKVNILEPPYMVKTYFALTKKKGASYKALAEDLSKALTAFKLTEEYKDILIKYGFVSRNNGEQENIVQHE